MNNRPPDQLTRKKSIFREYAESLIFAIILALIIKTSLVEAYKIPSGSMENTLLVGDFLLANKFIYGAKIPLLDAHLPAIREPKPGDVIIFKFPLNLKQNYIKRLIATEGQVVAIRNKKVFVDGKPFPLPSEAKYSDPNVLPPPGTRDNFGPVKVPPGKLFVMGDNRDNSYDSRFWGYLDRRLVLGKAMILHWSWEPDQDETSGSVSAYDQRTQSSQKKKNLLESIGSKIVSIGYDVVRIPWKVRWGRVARIIH